MMLLIETVMEEKVEVFNNDECIIKNSDILFYLVKDIVH